MATSKLRERSSRSRRAGIPVGAAGRGAAPAIGVTVQQHHSALTILGTVFRPFSFAWGQHVRIDFKSVDRGHTDVMIECAFPFPRRVDFSHENERTLAMIESFVLAREAGSADDRAG